MKHVILPKDPITAKQETASDVNLGGCFYDYLRSTDGKMVGVRYWTIEPVIFKSHLVYSQFLGDERFFFDQASEFVDIVFDERCAVLLLSEQLTVDVVQEFGGESVVKCGEQFGIIFSIPDEHASSK